MEKQKILLIDDNADIRNNTAEILELSNYEVAVAENGKVGIETAHKFHPNLIICDIMMPVLDGYGVLMAIQKTDDLKQIPFLFLSAKSERTDLRKGMELGADDYITKPFSASELLTAIDIRLKKAAERATVAIEDPSKQPNFLKNALQQLLLDREHLHYKKKHHIYTIGNHPNKLFYLVSGKVKVYKTTDAGKQFIVELPGPGEFLGYASLLESSSYIDTAEVLEDCEVAVIPKEDFLQVFRQHSDVTEKFVKLLASNLLNKEQQLLNMAYNSLRRKVADALLHLHSKGMSKNDPDPVIQLSRDNLAALAGTATESLIRTLSDFKQEKLIAITDGNITLLNQKKLSESIT